MNQPGVPRHNTSSCSCSRPFAARSVNQLATTTGEITDVGIERAPVGACANRAVPTVATASAQSRPVVDASGERRVMTGVPRNYHGRRCTHEGRVRCDGFRPQRNPPYLFLVTCYLSLELLPWRRTS